MGFVMAALRPSALAAVVVGGFGLALPARAQDLPSFERHVRPILKAYCLDCHGGGPELKGKLDLRLVRSARRGGKTGPALIPGQPQESLLLARIQAGEMPPGEKKVPTEAAALIEQWISAGARTSREEPESLPPGIDITPEDRAFWAFQPIRRKDPPPSRALDRVRTPIDAFIQIKLRERGLAFSSDADKRTLALRAAFDLTGLPPAREELEAFLADGDPDAYERMIDRMLAMPQYGERWARHWLDVAGYADSDGNGNDDTERPYAYKYRDYVIRSLSADRPLDRFLIEQLAGDELVPRPWSHLTRDQVETLAATGFLRTAVDGTAAGAPDEPLAANQVVADTIKIVGSTFLGLTVGCAQCHDHRYDPIPQSDYYRLRAVFEPALDPVHWRRPAQRLVSLYTDADRAQATAVDAEAGKLEHVFDAKTRKYLSEALEKELAKLPEDLRGKLREAWKTPEGTRSPEQKQLLAAHPSVNISAGVLYQYNSAAADDLKKDRAKIDAVRARKPVEDFLSVLDEVPGVLPETHVFHRGDHRQRKQAVGPGDLTIAAPDGKRFEIAAKDPGLATSGRRLALARRLVDGRHPLVGRVLANRIWLHHFGRGLVETPGDFGALGNRPSHPELLDWLASELVRQGWSLKRMHRLIMTSTVYRQSSRRGTADSGGDPENHWYGHYPVRRLDAEALRDRILAVSGRLDVRPYGPPVPLLDDSVGQVAPANDSPRRSVYLQVRRTRPVSFLAAFDAPVMTVNCERRLANTGAPQSLMLLNSHFVLSHAQAMARRLRSARPPGPAAKERSLPDSHRLIDAAWQLAYQRPISPEERAWARGFVAEQLEGLGKNHHGGEPDLAVLSNLCQQLLISNEFLYVD
jgi:hypothetical protein